MSKTITAQFDSRRDAEMAIEHLVQEHGIDPNAVRIGTVSEMNTAGTKVAGADVEGGHEKAETEGSPALEGRVTVSATIDAAQAEAVTTSFETYKGSSISS